MQVCINFKIKIKGKLCTFITFYRLPNPCQSLWYNNNITTYESSKVDGVTSQFGLEKVIKKPTHIIGDSSRCIDLIFTNQANFVMECGVHHHKTLAKFILKIHHTHPDERELWYYQKANVNQIRQTIIKFPLNSRSCKYQRNEQGQLLTQTIQNIISNYIPHETITWDDRNPP